MFSSVPRNSNHHNNNINNKQTDVALSTWNIVQTVAQQSGHRILHVVVVVVASTSIKQRAFPYDEHPCLCDLWFCIYICYSERQLHS